MSTLDGSTPTLCSPPATPALWACPPAASSKQRGAGGWPARRHRRATAGLSPRGWRSWRWTAKRSPGRQRRPPRHRRRPSTHWHAGTPTSSSPTSPSTPGQPPHRIAGFVFLPRQTACSTAPPTATAETSGRKAWTVHVDGGSFANVRNNPDQQEVRFAQSQRFTSATVLAPVWGNGWASAAELSGDPSP